MDNKYRRSANIALRGTTVRRWKYDTIHDFFRVLKNSVDHENCATRWQTWMARYPRGMTSEPHSRPREAICFQRARVQIAACVIGERAPAHRGRYRQHWTVNVCVAKEDFFSTCLTWTKMMMILQVTRFCPSSGYELVAEIFAIKESTDLATLKRKNDV